MSFSDYKFEAARMEATSNVEIQDSPASPPPSERGTPPKRPRIGEDSDRQDEAAIKGEVSDSPASPPPFERGTSHAGEDFEVDGEHVSTIWLPQIGT